MCQACSGTFDAMHGMNPKLDKPLCAAPPGSDPAVTVHLSPPTSFAPTRGAAVPAPTVVMPAAVCVPQPVMHRGPENLYHAIESDWHAIQLLESKNLMLRTQLNSQLTRLMSLNRDLGPEERNASDAMDHRDWQDARRIIREAVAVLSRVVRAHDIGTTSAAGCRNKFDDIVDHYVTPRQPIANLAEVQHQFEVHRKTVQSLHTEMHTASHGHGRDGETKAQQVLARIRVKLQAARGKR